MPGHQIPSAATLRVHVICALHGYLRCDHPACVAAEATQVQRLNAPLWLEHDAAQIVRLMQDDNPEESK